MEPSPTSKLAGKFRRAFTRVIRGSSVPPGISVDALVVEAVKIADKK